MKIRPLQDRILVKHMDEEATTTGGITIPDSANEKPQFECYAVISAWSNDYPVLPAK